MTFSGVNERWETAPTNISISCVVLHRVFKQCFHRRVKARSITRNYYLLW